MSQFEEFGGADGGEAMECAVFEAMCPEAVDGTLTTGEQRAFEKHVAGCVHCSQELAEAQRGAAWMAMLKGSTPEPPVALLQRILAETTGARAFATFDAPVVAPVVMPVKQLAGPLMPQVHGHEWGTQSGWVAPVVAKPSVWASLVSRMDAMFSVGNAGMGFQPRLAMTAAMAFFSVALTLNMMGVRAKDIRAGLTRPATLQRTFADASASATRSFQNMRVVYEVESRVSDMRNNSGLDEKLSEKLNDEKRDPSGPFANGPSRDGSSPDGSGQKSAPEQQQQPAQQQPATVVPQGKSELEYPALTGAAARKGA